MRFLLVVLTGCFLLGWTAACSDSHVDETERRVEELLQQMTLAEKIGQMNQVNGRQLDEQMLAELRSGSIGSILNIEEPSLVNEIQRIAVEESRLGIPILVARDVIHGYKTIFPIPLGQAASFNPDLVELGCRIAAKEATEDGIRWTFAPMMDVSRDPRWGRMAESFGEDVWLTQVMSLAMVKGFQGDSLNNPEAMAACAKHFVGYGAAEGGRDYNSTFIPERQMRDVYFPPFQTVIEAGCASVMTSFNDNDGIPSSGNKSLLDGVLREEWGFDGVVVSDWASVHEMVVHGFCEDDKEAARLAVNAGLDMEMESRTYIRYLEELVAEDKVSEAQIDEAVRNVLRMKFRLGLFEDPYLRRYENSSAYAPEHLDAAQEAAEQSMVLLKNDMDLLPFGDNIKRIALIGPLADAPHDQMGTWVFDGEKQHTITPLAAFKQMLPSEFELLYEPGLSYSRDKERNGFSAAVEAVQASDVAVVIVGEEAILSGEAHSLADIDLKGAQSELVAEVSKVGKPVVLVVMAGRPLVIEEEVKLAEAVLYAWHPGTMGGAALVRILTGKVNPSGKLPVSFPRMKGQIPVHYNHNRTGRPARGTEVLLDDIPLEARQSSLGNTSYYLDAGLRPLFAFGYGLSYTKFQYDDLVLGASEIGVSDTLNLSFTLSNTGSRSGWEVVQLYANDPIASVTRPVKELKGFKRVWLEAGSSQRVTMKLPASKLAFWNIDMEHKIEVGAFNIMVGGSSEDGLEGRFWIVEKL